MNKGLQQAYNRKKEIFNASEKKLKKSIQLVSLLRFLSFILIPVSLIYLTRIGLWIGIISGMGFLIIFLIFVKKHIFFNKERKRNTILIKIVENELLALKHKFSQFENGSEFIDPGHNYSFDLDLFGEGSLFQFLNRTSTISGKRVLSQWLQNPPFQNKEIEERQEAVKEIGNKRDWRLGFLATGKMFDESALQHDEVMDWAEKSLSFKNYKLIGILRTVLPVLTLLMLIPAIWLNVLIPLYISIFSQWILLYLYRKRVKEYYRFFGQKSQLIEKYVSLLNEIEKEDFLTSWLKKQKNKITNPESAGHIIGKLGKLVREFEFRQNMIAGLVLNSFFLWDIRCVYLLRKWHIKNCNKLVEWLEVIENTDALISLANFADNNQEYCYPELVSDNFEFNAKELGHPLLDPTKRICSNFDVKGWSNTIIVTGANMAGKSTFLRAVGVNLVLGRMGAPVCASEFCFKPVGLYTNMRTTDSLFNDESYFYAELKRLSYILRDLEKGQELFVILDEMLKGTNSVDKLNGSKELIRKLVQFKSVALIATHDLKLSEMEKEFPDNIFNKCFEIKITDNELVFDYKLTDGITQTMNATFLMKKMGII
ncbi:MAG: hypothetical protein HQ541_05165 [Mariniphaga sp.]|nr:hypothetical protein [Mariniphaga sp.]